MLDTENKKNTHSLNSGSQKPVNDGSVLEPFIFFELANTTYGIRSKLVQQMEMVEQITPVPNAPSFVEGVVFSRGQVIPTLNLRVRFGFEKVPYDARTRLIVINTGGRIVGVIADTAREFISIPVNSIQPPPEAIAGLSGKYLSGIATLGDRIVLILNVEELLNSAEEIKMMVNGGVANG
jgi:purine-binding chemotaxis protein CheW